MRGWNTAYLSARTNDLVLSFSAKEVVLKREKALSLLF